MPRNLEDTDMSELEREFELELEDEPSGEAGPEPSSYELDDQEAGSEEFFEAEPLQEFEGLEDAEYEEGSSGYGERFFELAQREYESDDDREAAANEVLREMEQDFFLSKLVRGGSKFLTKAVKAAAGTHPAFGLLKLAANQLSGPLRGKLGALASTALSMYPGGAALVPVLKSLGFGEGGDGSQANKEAWDNFASFAREAYENLADNVGERELKDPAAAMQRASQALQAARAAVRTHPRPGPARGYPRAGTQIYVGGGARGRGRRVYRLRVPRHAIVRGLVIRIEVV